LQSANRKIDTVYFPESGLASVVAIGGGERKQAEVAIIGREGIIRDDPRGRALAA
jgi:hypothetical protein